MDAAAEKSKLDKYVIGPAALLAVHRSWDMPAVVTPPAGVVVLVAPAVAPGAVAPGAVAPVAVVADAAPVVDGDDEEELSLPHAANTSASTAATTGSERRNGCFIGPPGSRRGVLGAVPAKYNSLQRTNQEGGGGAEEGQHEDRTPELEGEVEGLGLLHRPPETA